MSETRNESHSNGNQVVSSPSIRTFTRQSNSEGCFHDISLSSSVPICRICHGSCEDEELMQPCRCSGSVGYAHESCIRKWIVGSANVACELCGFKFRIEIKRILDFRKVTFGEM